MPQPAPTVSFLAAGDLHTGQIPQERLSALFAAAARHADAAFLAVPGDLTNDALPEQYALLLEHTRRLPFPFLGTMGNHDVHTGPDALARERFTSAMGVEGPSYVRRIGGCTFVFLSTDRDVDGESVTVAGSLEMLEEALASAEGPVFAFCHAPLTGTVGGMPGRACLLSDTPHFGLPESAEVRRLVAQAGKPVVFVAGHTHSPVEADRLICTEPAGNTVLHSVNVSSPYFTGGDIVRDAPVHLYRFDVRPGAVRVRIENVARGAVVRDERLAA